MPELPEVQTTVDGIEAHTKGLIIADAWTDYGSKFHIGKNNIANPEFFTKFRKSVKGAKIAKAHRRGKNVLVDLDNGKTIIIHMKMTGHVMYGSYKKLAKKDPQGEQWRPTDSKNAALNDPFNRFIHLVLPFTNGKSLVLSDMRKFAKVSLADTQDLALSEHLSTHGPEPLDKDFTAETFKGALMKRPRGKIKQTMMDHTIVSGIGNIYSDEILWRAGVHPLRKVEDVNNKEWKLLYKAMRETLLRGIDFGGDSMSDYRNILGERGKFQNEHNAYQKTGERCKKRGCSGTICRIKVGGRSGHYCDKHQHWAYNTRHGHLQGTIQRIRLVFQPSHRPQHHLVLHRRISERDGQGRTLPQTTRPTRYRRGIRGQTHQYGDSAKTDS
ncbi:MAG: bifunctional DNA-formamidopyrimidine glycosylase/DNA-(apurinic or apyrimidinic site) lyase [bacterium]|nr:bifunctional DNA-formamidopyrimidine glycosylase/DNA-(apurinic or apyrimidinic site) lyase [bacterium]